MKSIRELQTFRLLDPSTGFSLDLSRLGMEEEELEAREGPMQEAFRAMGELEAGALANPDEGRRVGHYWLRAPELAPDGLGGEIQETLQRILDFARGVQEGRIRPPRAHRFGSLCLIGIGGSALGPQLLQDALAEPGPGLRFACLDNTDPDGIRRSLRRLGHDLGDTLFLVISKSGGTRETRNSMLEAMAAARAEGLDFSKQALAVTGRGSPLEDRAEAEGWLARFPMWDWVGGRTSVCSAVGMLPAALLGIDVLSFLNGAAAMDRQTRIPRLRKNLAALMAAGWHHATGGRGARDLVVLPYRDRLLLLGRYLQQLCMESLGKEKDLQGRTVHQGLTVYGNKGSTDQHAYVQQLREGVENFFVCFLRVLEDGNSSGIEVEPGITSADYLQGFFIGTRKALSEKGRPNLTLTLPRLDAWNLGALLALFERAVGLYASLVGINAYHQPGVEAGKKAAGEALALRGRLLEQIGREPIGLAELCEALGPDTDPETVFLLLEHLAANGERTGIRKHEEGWSRP